MPWVSNTFGQRGNVSQILSKEEASPVRQGLLQAVDDRQRRRDHFILEVHKTLKLI